ncbi:reticulon-3 isoform X1 [Eleutherodactylus coqui]|uniref:reticulon-3 isoform X1 n=1 Tax=Eleutherodactylus coqui TaxID=57060 RepID=UPI003462D12B
MAETGGHQSSHISSSSVGEKKGSCAEHHPKHPSPESPGSPFEMIANSSGFDLKDCEDKAINHGLSQISAQSPGTDEPLLAEYEDQRFYVSKEDPFMSKFSMQNVITHRPEDFEPGHLSTLEAPIKLIDHQIGFLQEGTEEIFKPSINDSKADLRWPDAEEDLDSSGESDDTVIDAGWRVKASVADPKDHAEDGWVELSDTRQENEPRSEAIKSDNAINSNTLPLTSSASEKLSSTISKTPDSPHNEGFVDLVETCVNDTHTGTTYYSESESLEDKVQESLTIEALKALAAGVQDWNSESRESSPEILSPQCTHLLELKERLNQAELHLESAVAITTLKGKEELLSNAPLA